MNKLASWFLVLLFLIMGVSKEARSQSKNTPLIRVFSYNTQTKVVHHIKKAKHSQHHRKGSKHRGKPKDENANNQPSVPEAGKPDKH